MGGGHQPPSERSVCVERSTGALRRSTPDGQSAPDGRSAPPERYAGALRRDMGRNKKKKRGREGPIKLKMTSDRSFGCYRTRQLPVESGCATVRVQIIHSCQLGLGTSLVMRRGGNTIEFVSFFFNSVLTPRHSNTVVVKVLGSFIGCHNVSI